MTASVARTYSVAGMTCGHCKAAVMDEVAKVPGVESVAVDLDGGTVTVAGAEVDDDAVRAAVDEAGYRVTS